MLKAPLACMFSGANRLASIATGRARPGAPKVGDMIPSAWAKTLKNKAARSRIKD